MADEMLQTALVNFPGVLLPLLDKCSIDAEDKVARHPFFVDSQRGQVEMTKRTKYQTFICIHVPMVLQSAGGTGAADEALRRPLVPRLESARGIAVAGA